VNATVFIAFNSVYSSRLTQATRIIPGSIFGFFQSVGPVSIFSFVSQVGFVSQDIFYIRESGQTTGGNLDNIMTRRRSIEAQTLLSTA
jgi:hypothetical protein